MQRHAQTTFQLYRCGSAMWGKTIAVPVVLSLARIIHEASAASADTRL